MGQIGWLAFGVLLAVMVCGLTLRWRRHRARRLQTYAELASRRDTYLQDHPSQLADPSRATVKHAEFERTHLVTVPDFLQLEDFERLREATLPLTAQAERSYIPFHKKGGTVSYEALQREAPACVALYHSPELQQFIATVTGTPIEPTPDRDQSSLSLLCYVEAGDHIQWHYDHNFYVGRHFTVLLPLVNTGPNGGLSQSTFQRQLPGRQIASYDTSPNSLVIFEGARVRHRATPVAAGDVRVMLSMTYTTDPRISRFKEAIRRIKDTAFYGWRALWD